MKYNAVKRAIFCRRINRFLGEVLLGDEKITVHIKNTGRCRELLVEGASVYLSKASLGNRKTAFDLIAVIKRKEDGSDLLINMDSQAPNAVVASFLPQSGIFSESAVYKREVNFGKSRFDFYVEDRGRKAFLEVKGVTLEEDGCALFPDAPTQRGAKHLKELADAVKIGYEAYVLFLIQMKGCTWFTPNHKTDPVFCEALREAVRGGVQALAFDCRVLPDEMIPEQPIPIRLDSDLIPFGSERQ